MYVNAIGQAFPSGVDYAQIVKEYEAEPAGAGRYSPPKVTATEKTPVFGSPVEELVSTSYVERQNLTMRMQIGDLRAHQWCCLDERSALALTCSELPRNEQVSAFLVEDQLDQVKARHCRVFAFVSPCRPKLRAQPSGAPSGG